MNIDRIKALFEEIQSLINQDTIEKQKNGDCFNLLEVSGISTLEVKMCRILAEIINPKGSHYQGILFLESFVRDVLKTEIENEELEKSMVVTEYPTDKGRRIDIVIMTPQRLIPIEVKLYAKDQENQCADYYNFAKTKGSITSKVFYLTIDGHLPHEDKGLTPVKQNGETVGYEEVTSISFINDVCRWLGSIKKTILDKPLLYANIVQFKNALEKLGGNMGKELNYKIVSLISKNSDTLKTALAISDSINIAKENLLLKIFEQIEEKMNLLKYPIEQLNNEFDYKYDDYYTIHNYYSKKTFPALLYKYKQIDDSKEIWFVIELGAWGGLYCGFVLAENGDNPQKLVLSDEEIKTHFKNSFEMNKEDWWFYWRYLPSHDGEYMPETNPDFKACSESYLKLFDDGELENFIDTIMVIIDITLQKMIGLTMIEKCKLHEMPKENETFVLERLFSQREMNELKKGHIAKEMEDKWCSYYENGKLYIHRSWTKKCIYIITFNNESNCHEVVVNRYEKQYIQKDVEKDISLLNDILSSWTNLE